ncbi:hypothetical protein PSN45_003115 [Yamadazyma tenuis]|uniref:Gylcosyl hydrolase 115 C-terminal domain-containing protein n=1 Tax=Candida tenuis (strain ATCC 10573 / BCRC 21748 / CBS 615 / JCM 9827 / NBRC 10315 / NRRL Y-1498 / VKM Y-70) TaxID=590646 RepID=G3AZC8_CANTC|nr:uncharacterized protein CANTEDRAFT_133492 [Yamadazyma tenuis ATCC 10573]EGV66063.1 hypothetical protein CANTEDRAFT_133492 [Yamadazyma tenuis ATCC 10573]WEJ95592.1 hypothetical protein PSN45_003115 [Yamadazyma tenuis]
MYWFWCFLSIVTASIVFEEYDETIPIYTNASTSRLVFDPADWPGVIRAAHDLRKDFEAVTGKKALQVANDTLEYCSKSPTIIIGTIGNSSIIDNLVKNNLIDIRAIEHKWESYIITHIKGCNTVVVAGSDKRGTIFGIYTISGMIGVSPWYFWADVPIESHSSVYFNTSAPIVSGEPSVKYRGIFINDEEPSLSTWVNRNFDQGNYTHYVHEFYFKVFELLLRQKANLLWPAMWKAMFGLDDGLNQYWADYYGIVMSTSHTEPLQRASNEWLYEGEGSWDYTTNEKNITEYWKDGIARGKAYEGVWVEGMRGLGDTAMSDGVESALLEKIIAHQRDLLVEGFGEGTNISTIPQVWCLYKEVQSYYQKGMSVPDDIILLWVDDNWGNIRRLPQGDETSRSGGAGIYYHFDYVGDPRNYKWINTVSLTRTWEQMHMAYERQAREFWVVNVGDLKGLEVPIAYFLDLAYDYDQWGQVNKVPTWTRKWAEQQFGEFAPDIVIDEISDIVEEYSFLAGRLKYELLDRDTYTLLNYNEAQMVLDTWKTLSDRAWNVYNNSLSKAAKPAFFEMILHPCHAGYIVHDLHITAGKNDLYTSQQRNQASSSADHVKEAFQDDFNWKKKWDALLDGKWKNMMDQPHLSYSYWQNPMRDVMPAVSEILLETEAMSGSGGLTIDGALGVVPGDDVHNGATYNNNTLIFPELNPYSGNTWIEVFSRGYEDFEFKVTPWNDYVSVTPSSGIINASNQSLWNSIFLNVSVDWDQVDDGFHLEFLNFTTNSSTYFYTIPTILNLPINKTENVTSFTGYIESQGYVSIEAEHTTANISQNDTYFLTIPRFGRTLSGVTLYPINSESQVATEDASYLEYDFYAFSGSNVTNVTLIFSPSLNVNPFRPLRYGVAVDDDEPEDIQIYEDNTDPTAYPVGWEEAVAANAWTRNTTHDVDAGPHTLKVWLLEPGVVLQKIVIDFGGARPSYLGPPESYFLEEE